VFLFFLYVPYERRYCDAKSESGNFLLRNVVVIVINVIVDHIYMSSFHVQLQLLTQEALVIASAYMSKRERAKERGRKQIVFTSRAPSAVHYGQWRERRDVYIMHYSERSAARREPKRY